jgi:hypothetical protein
MPRALRKRERIAQIFDWLVSEFPTPMAVDLKMRKRTGKLKLLGWVERDGRRLSLHINTRAPLYVCVDTVLHEFGHAMSWPASRLENSKPDHDETWALAYGRIYAVYHDGGGRLRSYRV